MTKLSKMVRHFPEQNPRVETGKIQFGNDWSGVFIRGDNAQYYSKVLNGILKNKMDDPVTEITINELIELLNIVEIAKKWQQDNNPNYLVHTKVKSSEDELKKEVL